MKGSQLIALLNTFRRKEWIESTKFVASPFHNSRKDVVDLLAYFKKVIPRGQADKLEKPVIFRALFPREAYEEKRIRYALSFLFQVLQDYLAYSEWTSGQLRPQLALLRAYRKRGLNRSFEISSHKTAKQLDQQAFRNQEYHYCQFLFHQEQYIFSATQSRRSTSGFQEWAHQSTLFFMIQQLQQACVALSHQTVLENTYDLPLFEAVLQEVRTKDYSHSPALLVYFHLYKTLKGQEEDQHFPHLKSLIVNSNHYFPSHELRSIYLLAINYCIQQLNAGKSVFLEHAFAFYKEGLAADIFLENGYLSRFTYNNIALAGMGLKAFEWTENFLKRYHVYIEAKYRESTLNFNLANLYYRKRDFSKAMSLLRQSDFQDVLHGLEARKMLLVSYFEMSEMDALESLLESFKNLVYRQKDIGYHRGNYLNLIRFTHQLLRLHPSDDSARLKLEQRILDTGHVAEKEWLLRKVRGEEMKK